MINDCELKPSYLDQIDEEVTLLLDKTDYKAPKTLTLSELKRMPWFWREEDHEDLW